MKQLITLSLLLLALIVSPLSYAQKVLLLADNHMSKGKMQLIKSLAKDKQIEFDYDKFSNIKKEQAGKLFSQYQLVLFDALNPRIAKSVFAKFNQAIKDNTNTKFEPIRMPFDSPYRRGITQPQALAIKNYYHNGGRFNFENLMAYISKEIFANQEYSYHAYQALPDNGFYHYALNNTVTDKKSELDNSIQRDKSLPLIAIAMHRSSVESEQTQVIDQVIKAVEKQGAQAFGYFFDGATVDKKDAKSATKYLQLLQDKELNTWVDAIINTRMIHYMDKRKADFTQLNVPVLHALNYYDGDQNDYEKDHSGLSATMSPYFLMMPETSGVIDPTIITSKNHKTEEQEVIQYQLDALAQRALMQAQLKHKGNQDKKIAFMIWNYPPGEKNIGAAFLNVPRSLEQMTNQLIKAGYNGESKNEEYYINNAGGLLKPLYRTGYKKAIKDMGLTGYLPLKDYQAWFAELPQTIQDEINQHWGQAKDHPFIEQVDGQPQFMVARMINGNIMTMPQPTSASNEDEQKDTYHSGNAPASHYYFAAYLYLKKTFGADAIIHVGTHGSLEWLKGKERGLSIYDSPSLAVGNLPAIYPFLMDNVGEAMQAKRRGRATMIAHMTPAFAAAGLHSDIKQLDELMHQHEQLDEGETKRKTEASIIEQIKAMNMLKELQIAADSDFNNRQVFAEVLEQVHVHLHELSIEAQPLGLHTFGVVAKDSHLITTIQQMISPEARIAAQRFENKHQLADKIQQLPAEDNIIEQEFSAKMQQQAVTQLTDIAGFKLLWLSLVEGQSFELDKKLQIEIDQAKKFFADFKAQQETRSLIATLDAEFLEVAPGGDPIRNPQALPSGRNLIGFNPAKVPSKEAYQTGKELVADTINKYRKKHGHYPDKLAFSLWSLETMRQHGVLESQIMAALGVKPKWDHRGMVIGTEIIEYKDLKRPRIDVAISATGLYRDAFPNVMLLLAKAIDDIAKLKEDNNSIYKNAQTLKQKLLDNGASQQDADYLSSVRIFSNETGAYGTGLAGASLASDTWQTDSKLSDMYLERMGYAFGPDASRWSEKPDSKTIKNLYSDVLSGTDAVVFSRSSNVYGMITSDDPFQYFGGISLAVRNIDGKSPEMYISNLRNPNQVKNESLQKFIGRELRTRVFHPRWIKEMKNEGYSGALTVLSRVNNFWGWTVMDPDSTNNEQWQEFVEVYVNDKYDMQLKEFFEKNNPYALAQIVERMLEAERKEYFETDQETLKKLTETYLELANKYDIYSDNKKFTEQVENLAQGFGIDFKLPTKQSTKTTQTVADSRQQQERVEGQKLEKQTKHNEQQEDYEIYYVLLFLLAFFSIGFIMRIKNSVITKQ